MFLGEPLSGPPSGATREEAWWKHLVTSRGPCPRRRMASRLAFNQEVAGPIPVWGTKRNISLGADWVWLQFL